MTVQRRDTEVYSLRFNPQGKDFAIEARLSMDDGEAQVGLYDEGRLIFSEVCPVEAAEAVENPEEVLGRAAETLRAQVEELYAFTEEMSDSVDPDLWSSLGELFATRGIFDEAVRLFETACKFDPGNSRLQYRLGCHLNSQGKYSEACKPLSYAVSEKPLYADFRNAYGYALVLSGQVSEGFKQIEQALELNTYYTDALFAYGICLLFNGIKGLDRESAHDFLARAQGVFEKAGMADESVRGAEFERGMRFLKSGEVREALSAFRMAREISRQSKELSYENLRGTFVGNLRSTDRQAALGHIRSLVDQLAQNPDYVDLEYELGVAHLKLALCDWNTGLSSFKAAIERNPKMKKALIAHDVAYALFQEMDAQTKKLSRSSASAEEE